MPYIFQSNTSGISKGICKIGKLSSHDIMTSSHEGHLCLISGFICFVLLISCSLSCCPKLKVMIGSFNSLNLTEVSNCQSFSDLKIVTGNRPKERS